jgi:uncharacterized repeat protein (TIGR01451 family)
MALEDITLKKDKVADVYCTDQGTITYTLRVLNDSTDPLQLEYFRDEFEEGNLVIADIIEPTTGNPLVWVNDSGYLEVRWTGTDAWIAGKASSKDPAMETIYYVTVALSCTNKGKLRNKIFAKVSDHPEKSSNTGVDTVIQAKIDLSITKVVLNEPIYEGDPIHFKITVTNNGPCPASQLYIDDTITPPAGDNYVPTDTVTWVRQSANKYRYTFTEDLAGNGGVKELDFIVIPV